MVRQENTAQPTKRTGKERNGVLWPRAHRHDPVGRSGGARCGAGGNEPFSGDVTSRDALEIYRDNRSRAVGFRAGSGRSSPLRDLATECEFPPPCSPLPIPLAARRAAAVSARSKGGLRDDPRYHFPSFLV